MSIVVMKFGGTSVADADKIRAAARRAIRTQKKGHQVVMVVSAMGKTTDRLEALAHDVSRRREPSKREWDQLMVTGEQVTISLMAMALEDLGATAISFTAGQIGMVTDDMHSKARIKRIAADRIHEQLGEGKIVIIAGFQGVTEKGHMTTLGRGGSNVTLVAIAAAIGADVCENYTDVDGVYTTDPRLVPTARKIKAISYEEMLELASLGANVLHNRAVEFAKKYNVPIHVRSSLNNTQGTMIVSETEYMEHIVVSGAALKTKIARISLRNVPDTPGIAAKIFHTLATHTIVVDDIIQTVSDDKTTAVISFTVDMIDLREARKVCNALAKTITCKVAYEEHLAKVSVVGVGMRVHTGVAERMFAALAAARVNIENITTSEIKISCLVDQAQGVKALRVVHDAFDLGQKRRAKKAPKKTAKKKATRKTPRKTPKKTPKKNTPKARRPKA